MQETRVWWCWGGGLDTPGTPQSLKDWGLGLEEQGFGIGVWGLGHGGAGWWFRDVEWRIRGRGSGLGGEGLSRIRG